MLTVYKASRTMYFGEALRYAIKNQKFLIRHKIEMDGDTSDEVAAEDGDTKME